MGDRSLVAWDRTVGMRVERKGLVRLAHPLLEREGVREKSRITLKFLFLAAGGIMVPFSICYML